MKQLGIQSVVTKKFKPGYAIRDNINWRYLSTIMERYTKKAIAWALGKRMTVELVQKTLNKAVQSQNKPQAIILHSDQGCQYISHEYEGVINLYGMTHSFSRKEYPYHNASLE